MTYQTIAVEPLSPHIGAEISGVDLSKPLSNQAHAEIHDALMKHLVVFFRDQDIDLDQQKAFGRGFGTRGSFSDVGTSNSHILLVCRLQF